MRIQKIKKCRCEFCFGCSDISKEFSGYKIIDKAGVNRLEICTKCAKELHKKLDKILD